MDALHGRFPNVLARGQEVKNEGKQSHTVCVCEPESGGRNCPTRLLGRILAITN